MPRRQPALDRMGLPPAPRREPVPFHLPEFIVLNCAGCRVAQLPTGVVIVYCSAHQRHLKEAA